MHKVKLSVSAFSHPSTVDQITLLSNKPNTTCLLTTSLNANLPPWIIMGYTALSDNLLPKTLSLLLLIAICIDITKNDDKLENIFYKF